MSKLNSKRKMLEIGCKSNYFSETKLIFFYVRIQEFKFWNVEDSVHPIYLNKEIYLKKLMANWKVEQDKTKDLFN